MVIATTSTRQKRRSIWAIVKVIEIFYLIRVYATCSESIWCTSSWEWIDFITVCIVRRIPTHIVAYRRLWSDMAVMRIDIGIIAIYRAHDGAVDESDKGPMMGIYTL
jgi:hypothetical protein